jgi:hypothetical protein
MAHDKIADAIYEQMVQTTAQYQSDMGYLAHCMEGRDPKLGDMMNAHLAAIDALIWAKYGTLEEVLEGGQNPC